MNLRPIALCALIAVAGCQRESDGSQPANRPTHSKAPVAVQHGPTVEELTAGMVDAVTLGKSVAPVDLKFDVLRRPMQGEPLEVAIALIPGEPAQPATVEVSGQEGLDVPDDQKKFEFASVDPAQVYRHSIRLTPTAGGVYLLTLTVSLAHDQLTDSRVFSVPLIIAGSESAAPASGSPPASSPTT